MGKFDDAIEVLKSNVEGNAHVGIPAVAKDYCEKVQAAIRVLEAASKVDERDLGRVFMGFVSAEMRELLEAIKAAKEDE